MLSEELRTVRDAAWGFRGRCQVSQARYQLCFCLGAHQSVVCVRRGAVAVQFVFAKDCNRICGRRCRPTDAADISAEAPAPPDVTDQSADSAAAEERSRNLQRQLHPRSKADFAYLHQQVKLWMAKVCKASRHCPNQNVSPRSRAWYVLQCK